MTGCKVLGCIFEGRIIGLVGKAFPERKTATSLRVRMRMR